MPRTDETGRVSPISEGDAAVEATRESFRRSCRDPRVLTLLERFWRQIDELDEALDG